MNCTLLFHLYNSEMWYSLSTCGNKHFAPIGFCTLQGLQTAPKCCTTAVNWLSTFYNCCILHYTVCESNWYIYLPVQEQHDRNWRSSALLNPPVVSDYDTQSAHNIYMVTLQLHNNGYISLLRQYMDSQQTLLLFQFS